MARFLTFVGALAICYGMTFTSAWAFPVPVFYTPLESEASSITALGGTTPVDNGTFVPGIAGNAYQSTNSGTNIGGWAKWDDAAISTIFSSWNNANGITVDLYFGGVFSTPVTGTVNEGLWSMVRRNSATGGGGDNYVFASVQHTAALPGRLRIAFSNDSTNQYKFSFNGNAAVPASQEYADHKDIPLNDNTPYHLTMSIGNGAFNVWLDDMTGAQYSNGSPVYSNTNSDLNTLPSGFNWALPASGAVGSSGTAQGRQTREMDIGIRGFGNSGNTVNNFGGSIRSGTWIDEVSVYNGIYTPADLPVYSVGTPVDGDYNGDHEVNAADYIIWRKTYGANGNNSGLETASTGDGTGDGNVLANDYDYWRARFGSVTGSGAGGGLASGAAIPEPSTVMLAVGICLAFAMRRSRQK